MFFRPQHLHFVGIGGIGMSGIAEVLLNLGYRISGSDLKKSPITDRLAALGAEIFEGHSAENVGDATAVVITSAVDATNPEVAAAVKRNVPVIPRGELLAELMRLKFGIAVGGSHGKTSTTSMTATVLAHAGKDPTVVVGGRVATLGGSNARVGTSDLLVVESDESDGSFLKLAPILAVVTNIDREHLDHYGTFEGVLNAFVEFVNKVPFYGAAILCIDNEHVQSILPRVRRRMLTYGASTQADLVVSRIVSGGAASDFDLRLNGNSLGTFHIPTPGRHNVLNATAAVAVGLELELSTEEIRQGLAQYRGVDRRFQAKGQAAGVVVVDDYGHHPTEIRATLEAARLGGYGRILALFQPHRYSRTQSLMDEFAKSFHQADAVWVTDIYAASEPPIDGVTAEVLVRRMTSHGHRAAHYAGSIPNAVAGAVAEAKSGDLVLTLGAGSITQAGDQILKALEARN